MGILAAQEFGDQGAPSILFLHGMGTTHWMWTPQVKALQEYHCIVPDLPGHGENNSVPYRSLEETSLTIADLIEARATNGKAHVVGLSLGAMIGLKLLALAPDCVDHVILSGVSVLPVPHMGLIRLALPLMMLLMKTDFALKQNAKALRIPDALYKEYKKGALTTNRRAFARIMRDSAELEIPETAGEIYNPVLFVAGEHEHPLILDSLNLLAQAFPICHAAIAPDVGHAWSIEKPALFTEMIKQWINGQCVPDVMTPLTDPVPVK